MPPTDASANAPTAPAVEIGTGTRPRARESRIDRVAGAGTDSEDTLDLRLPDELVALFAEDADAGGERSPGSGPAAPVSVLPIYDDLLDHVADWGPISTAAGVLHLVPVRIERDLPIISRWMNDPAVAAFWGLAGARTATEEHLRSQLTGDGRSVPCLGQLEGVPMSYWEIYRADLDPLARHYPARPHDTGLHLLIGPVGDRGQRLGGTLLRAVADLALHKRPACARIVAEPDIRNTPSVAAFLSAGFRFAAEIDLPAKRAALMVRERSLRHLL
ncbi:acetyltransferase [Streptomyces sp. ISL-22]|uniref:GNAT family N-acetyltransferase n=1 Tax=unclassified Streptomyces TaxID=2593676 RepID=UPI001BE6B6B8|nr:MULTISPECIES: GNAT family N-acetyltransferase [unclassified Streptomyces]MBT2419597.1 acetyltransferase [Streptomyces sp. ISL-24]MBT2432592.1 acetyltransferase [Streptomyces sp. ISL-22]